MNCLIHCRDYYLEETGFWVNCKTRTKGERELTRVQFLWEHTTVAKSVWKCQAKWGRAKERIVIKCHSRLAWAWKLTASVTWVIKSFFLFSVYNWLWLRGLDIYLFVSVFSMQKSYPLNPLLHRALSNILLLSSLDQADYQPQLAPKRKRKSDAKFKVLGWW